MILKFDDFVNSNRNAIESEVKTAVEEAVTTLVWKGLHQSTYFSVEEKIVLQKLTDGFDGDVTLNESLLGKMRDKLGTVAKAVGEETIKKLQKIMLSARAFAEYVSGLFMRAWDKLLSYFKKMYDTPKKAVLDSIKKDSAKFEAIKKNIKEDSERLKETSMFWLKDFPKKLAESIRSKFSKEVLSECLNSRYDVIEDLTRFDNLLTEESIDGKNSTLWETMMRVTHALEKIPPFNVLTQVKNLGENGAKAALKKVSEITKACGGPGVYDFSAISIISGFMFEYYIKSMTQKGIEDILKAEAVLRFIPFASDVIRLVSAVALIVAIVEIIKNLGEFAEETAQ